MSLQKENKQAKSKEIYTCNNAAVIAAIECTPILSESRMVSTVIKNSTLHYYTCDELFTKIYLKDRAKRDQSLKVFTHAYLNENKLSICEKCLTTYFITDVSFENPATVNFAFRADFAYQVLRFATALEESKKRNLAYSFTENTEKLYQDLLLYEKLLKSSLDTEFVNLDKVPAAEHEYLYNMTKEAEKVCHETKKYLKSAKVDEIIQKEFLKLAGDSPELANDDKTILYGFIIAREFDRVLEPSGEKLNMQKKLKEYYKLIKLASFNQINNQESFNFAIVAPTKAAEKFLKSFTAHNSFANSKISTLTNFEETSTFLNKDTLELAYSVWRANNFTDYELALKAALLTRKA